MNRTTISTVLQVIAVGCIAYAWLSSGGTTEHLLLIAIGLILYLVSLAIDPEFRARMNAVSREPIKFRKPNESSQKEQ